MNESLASRFAPTLVLVLSVAIIVYLLWRAAQPDVTGPLWYLLAVPALLAGRLAWRRMQRP